jgi:D-glycero-D-manno-heptose 1,7-bisphosphate phosphatase
MNKCVFLDRDGVINKDFVDYAYSLDRFIILEGVREGITLLKEAGFLLVIVTNQSGLAKGVYTVEQMNECHEYMQQELDHQIDHFYFAGGHETLSESLMRKPNTLMFERAVAKFNIDIDNSWMIGDNKRDIIPALKMGLKTIQVDGHNDGGALFAEKNLLAAAKRISLIENGKFG